MNVCKGTLYVVATPIGNLLDITFRAVQVLSDVDIIAAEDTRHSKILLNHYNITSPTVSCHKFNEKGRVGYFIDELLSGKNIALISDAGTPSISDPGGILLAEAVRCGITITPVSGPSAVAAAVSASGFLADSFVFLGFLPKKEKQLIAYLNEAFTSRPIVFYESPKRIVKTMNIMAVNFPNSQVSLCNDLTKKFEKIYRGTPSEVLEALKENPAHEKGEYTCVALTEDKHMVMQNAQNPFDTSITLEARLVDIMVSRGCSLKEAAETLYINANKKIRKKDIYNASLRLKNILSQTISH